MHSSLIPGIVRSSARSTSSGSHVIGWSCRRSVADDDLAPQATVQGDVLRSPDRAGVADVGVQGMAVIGDLIPAAGASDGPSLPGTPVPAVGCRSPGPVDGAGPIAGRLVRGVRNEHVQGVPTGIREYGHPPAWPTVRSAPDELVLVDAGPAAAREKASRTAAAAATATLARRATGKGSLHPCEPFCPAGGRRTGPVRRARTEGGPGQCCEGPHLDDPGQDPGEVRTSRKPKSPTRSETGSRPRW